jgi:hypothetical protein
MNMQGGAMENLTVQDSGAEAGSFAVGCSVACSLTDRFGTAVSTC